LFAAPSDVDNRNGLSRSDFNKSGGGGASGGRGSVGKTVMVDEDAVDVTEDVGEVRTVLMSGGGFGAVAVVESSSGVDSRATSCSAEAVIAMEGSVAASSDDMMLLLDLLTWHFLEVMCEE
jgi:hypothetical protein